MSYLPEGASFEERVQDYFLAVRGTGLLPSGASDSASVAVGARVSMRMGNGSSPQVLIGN